MDTLSYWLLLVVVGLIAGVINTLAGGGSNLTLPALMVLGMPPEVANATNRVGVALQCLVGSLGFKRHNQLPVEEIRPILWPTISGGLLGSIIASYAPSSWLKPMLLGTMLTMAIVMLIRPSVIAPPPGTPARTMQQTPSAWWVLFLAGIYGGFVQAGVGFILIAALAGSLRYDLVRANALKLVCSLTFTLVALVVFVVRGQVDWVPGLILGLGTMTGAHLAVKMAIKAPASVLKWFLFVMTLCGCAAALWL
ncbi:permease [Pokkaliibacter plantistimulans]|uniref:Probable membrane transporter protein n=2 Tax=Pseudomonadota TaxID=1224 RepID=A0ABX5LYA2_9GAMM|nr:sulfite exporter TauE/SafE family protein [Pokkaliibacter plantistimulans]PPC75585.1 sulfite exporter TauE/SafE family protein [Pokkaliibacter plantistimulans]PXF30620.1 permease [Pokkaliibacter plantistimulans]